MNSELAEEIARLAAPIYAALLAQLVSIDNQFDTTRRRAELRRQAIAEALALRRETLKTEA